ncbi:hypothetical protein NADFUDRAFT_77196 [Nadsonia fulvescens var. elongata DSM 6958]|uniref:Uncharacterized protein n=1 Tax=Nadsonia fulvescens var. elongata DSM 6958 TaxID=857566 RepID=A0A1E3PQR0_9ASCO|nr:hypothetical protein NADFUDRAFT_77196 [Nadsonia fulvescens var. elongata DSM 6958]
MGNTNSTMSEADSAKLREDFHKAISQSSDLKTLNEHINTYLSNPANKIKDMKQPDISMENLLYRKHIHRDIFTPHKSIHKRMNSIEQYNFAESYLIHRDYLNTRSLKNLSINSSRNNYGLPFSIEPVVENKFDEINQSYNQSINRQMPPQQLLESFEQNKNSPLVSLNAQSHFRESLISSESFSSNSCDEGNLMSPPTSQDEWFSEAENSLKRNSTIIPAGLTSEQAQADLLDLLEQAIPMATQLTPYNNTSNFDRRLTVKELNSARMIKDSNMEKEVAAEIKAKQRSEMEEKLNQMDRNNSPKKSNKSKKSKSNTNSRSSTPIFNIKPPSLCKLTPDETTLTYPSPRSSPVKELQQKEVKEKRNRRATISYPRERQTENMTNESPYTSYGTDQKVKVSSNIELHYQPISNEPNQFPNNSTRRYTIHESSISQGELNRAIRSVPDLRQHTHSLSYEIKSENQMNYSSWAPPSPANMDRDLSRQPNYELELSQPNINRHPFRNDDEFDFESTKKDTKFQKENKSDIPICESQQKFPNPKNNPHLKEVVSNELTKLASDFLGSVDDAYPYRPVSQALPDFSYRQYTGRFGRQRKQEVSEMVDTTCDPPMDDYELNVGIPPRVPPHRAFSNATVEPNICTIDKKQHQLNDIDPISQRTQERDNQLISDNKSASCNPSSIKKISNQSDTSIYTRKCSFIRAKDNMLSQRNVRSNTVSEIPKKITGQSKRKSLDLKNYRKKNESNAFDFGEVNQHFMLDGYENDTTLKCVNWTRDSLMVTESGSEPTSNHVSREASMEDLKVNKRATSLHEAAQVETQPAASIPRSQGINALRAQQTQTIPLAGTNSATALKRNNTLTPVTILNSPLGRQDSLIHVRTSRKLSRYSTFFEGTKSKEKQAIQKRRMTVSEYPNTIPADTSNYVYTQFTNKANHLSLSYVDPVTMLDANHQTLDIPLQNPRRRESRVVVETDASSCSMPKDKSTAEAFKNNTPKLEEESTIGGNKPTKRCFSGLNFLEEDDVWTGRGDMFLKKLSFIVVD